MRGHVENTFRRIAHNNLENNVLTVMLKNCARTNNHSELHTTGVTLWA